MQLKEEPRFNSKSINNLSIPILSSTINLSSNNFYLIQSFIPNNRALFSSYACSILSALFQLLGFSPLDESKTPGHFPIFTTVVLSSFLIFVIISPFVIVNKEFMIGRILSVVNSPYK